MQTSNPSTPHTATVHWFVRLAAGAVGLCGLALLTGGIYLALLGGSWYYAVAGAGMVVAAATLWQGRLTGVNTYLLVLFFTVAWSIYDAGFAFWPSVPRLVTVVALGAVILLSVPLLPARHRPSSSRLYIAGGLALTMVFCGFLIAMFFPHPIISRESVSLDGAPSAATKAVGNNWMAWGKSGGGTRYAELEQITPENVKDLEVAWTARTGFIAEQSENLQDQTVPLYVDSTLYHCAPAGQVSALDGTTGEIKWQFDPRAQSDDWKRCRALAYVEAGEGDRCGARVVLTTVDARLIAIRAADGTPCPSFGRNGTVDLWTGMGDANPEFLTNSSGPIVARGKIVLGGRVIDNVTLGEPSGVVRAYDAITGAPAWVWDLGQPDLKSVEGQERLFTKGTPNVWSVLSYDERLGMVYLPLGNATPDIYGGQRRPFDDEYSSSIVALNIDTGEEVWKFQTVHHDLWDYDLPAQPILADLPDGQGNQVPALIQLTKRSQIFVLDRRTGEPIKRVQERPVPSSDKTIEGEYYADTQPYSIDMPAIGTTPLTEAQMWGATPIDQMVCRILFRKYRYDGEFTTPSTRWSIIWPGPMGGANYGGGAIDEERRILVMAEMRLPMVQRLVKREEADKDLEYTGESGYFFPMSGTPYIMERFPFFSPLMIPCREPIWGAYSGIDLVSGKQLWQQPAGTAKDIALGNVQPGLAFQVGLPPLGGATVTRSGLAFAGGFQDFYLRAYETATGRELWKGRLPTGTQAFPITYQGTDGQQYVVVSASGARGNPVQWGDYIIAFALKK
ncbi:membrane-bound PQQ-dependent dehydrogenase, glucose/quinate/shikimate family [Halopseudomonas maritima]|uniref:membrane-bound PQQ-dependent dehydrogenase, glucose/quinate/shikimate family n=1 Tax=Halopseudomonas maritima TaxID=2918528 RepID=UPI001EEC0DA1|nr:membrane-bound PQQ-dependent dehydrogenase, glucose/quinate/shikimate family [Halopseudomonas maritima]UJJ32526.1 membrane-bound PQQ-dependent dehydrogenase, glucose/quinate/shikimate family [Halopseudomonas maritima]